MHDLLPVAALLDLAPDDVLPWGPGVAKIAPARLWPATRSEGRGGLVLVTALTPTPAGEGKTTTAIGLAQGMVRSGRRAVLALRQPSLAPTLGAKGGASGAGRCRLEPALRIDLGLTGDLHAVTVAHDLLAAIVDDALHRERLGAAPAEVVWRRVLDLGDRALRRVRLSVGDPHAERDGGFDVTAASEVMAILALARDVADLKARLGRVVVALRADGGVVRARDLDAVGPMAALLADALLPNLVRTTEGAPALLHAGPFANVAHGCSSTLATRLGRALADWTITEAGFGFDLGGEKFLHLAAPAAGCWPDVVLIVASLRALAHHGGGTLDGPTVLAGLDNLDAHVAGCRAFGREPLVVLNVFDGDPPALLDLVARALADRGVRSVPSTAVRDGGEGALALADAVVDHARPGVPVALTPDGTDVLDALRTIATRLYGADDVVLTPAAQTDLARLRDAGLAGIRPCVAKTPLSLSDDAHRPGRPVGHVLTVRGLQAMAGAGHVVVRCGDVMTMPGLPERPRALDLDLTDDGRVVGR